MKPIKVMSVFGTRPEAIKMAPLVLELERRHEFESLVCVTAQHREMLDGVLDCFGIRPDFDLNIMRSGQSLEGITARVLRGLGKVLDENAPDLVLVHGDTTTTFAGALAAFYHKTPVGHIEAGLRTHDRYSPFPEEMNRALVSKIAEYHFAPTPQNARNLAEEGILDKVFITGNTVIDALNYTVESKTPTPASLADIDFENKKVIILTCHRRENYGQPMKNIFSAVRTIALSHKEVDIIYPVHLSPEVRSAARKTLGGLPNVYLIEPLDTVQMHRIMSKCYFVMTDSGGIQEEAPALGKPVMVLRRETERPEAVHAGTVILAGVEEENIIYIANELLLGGGRYERMARAVNPYGDGKACLRIADAILYGFGLSLKKPEDFCP